MARPKMKSPSAIDVIAHIREQAAALVRRANPGCHCTALWFAPKAAEVAEAMTRKLCLDLTDQGRSDLARKLRIAWDRTAAAVEDENPAIEPNLDPPAGPVVSWPFASAVRASTHCHLDAENFARVH